MELYFSPLTCSMASRIALYEAKAPVRFVEVDLKTRRTLDGVDFLSINPLGFVPTLRTDEGDLISENAAVLPYIADKFPEAGLAPQGGLARTRLHQWLSFTGMELHKALFDPLFDPKASDEEKTRTLERGNVTLGYLDNYLTGRTYLLDNFSVADAYLFIVLKWNTVTPVDLEKWPVVWDYYSRLRQRPTIAKALVEEYALYAEFQARHKPA